MSTLRISQEGDTIASIVWGALILMAAAAAVFLISIATEIARVYRDRAFDGSPTAHRLWLALAVFLLVLTICGLMLTVEDLAPVGLYTAAWSFLIYIAFVEYCDFSADRGQRLLFAANEAGLLEAEGGDPVPVDLEAYIKEGVILGEDVADGYS
jgi:hypothetical protein